MLTQPTVRGDIGRAAQASQGHRPSANAVLLASCLLGDPSRAMHLAWVASATTFWVSLGLVAAVVLVVTSALARAHGRRLEHRMAAELGRRWDEHRPSQAAAASESAGVGGADPGGPDAELRITLDDLLGQRDRLLEEFQDVQTRIQILKKEVERRRRLMGVDDQADVIVLHDEEATASEPDGSKDRPQQRRR
jgi:hypothetical protein